MTNVSVPDYESVLEKFYRSFLQVGDVCVDVGAHEGRHLFPMLECIGTSGHALAFEPIPRMAAKLGAIVMSRNLSNVQVHEMALSNVEGSTTFMVAEDAPGYSGILRRNYDVPTAVTEINVRLSTLNVMTRQLDRLDYLKIDAEGAEWIILRGGSEILDRLRPVISFEFGAASYSPYGVVPEEVHEYLSSLGYCVYDIRGQALDTVQFADSSRHQALWDYVALPNNRDHRQLLAVLKEQANV